MTSSLAANYPNPNYSGLVNEKLWTSMDNLLLTNYMRSKIVAEKTAWTLINQQSQIKLTTSLPGAIMGPFMAGRHGSTDRIFKMIFKGLPSPNVVYNLGDVRDVSSLHLLAFTNSREDNQRFIAQILKHH